MKYTPQKNRIKLKEIKKEANLIKQIDKHFNLK